MNSKLRDLADRINHGAPVQIYFADPFSVEPCMAVKAVCNTNTWGVPFLEIS